MNPAILVALARAVSDTAARNAVLSLRGQTAYIDTTVRVRGAVQVAETTTTRVTYPVDVWHLLARLADSLPVGVVEDVLAEALADQALPALPAAHEEARKAIKAQVERMADKRGLGRITEVAPRTTATVQVEEVVQ